MTSISPFTTTPSPLPSGSYPSHPSLSPLAPWMWPGNTWQPSQLAPTGYKATDIHTTTPQDHHTVPATRRQIYINSTAATKAFLAAEQTNVKQSRTTAKTQPSRITEEKGNFEKGENFDINADTQHTCG